MRILDGAFLDALETLDINVQQMKSGHYSGARRSRAYGLAEFADYREYVPGDDLRRIDWNAAARFDKYLIKRFIDEKQGRNCVYLDTSASMGFEPEKGFAALRWLPRWAICRCATWTACPSGCCPARTARSCAPESAGGNRSCARARSLTRCNSGGDRPVCVHPKRSESRCGRRRGVYSLRSADGQRLAGGG